MLPVRRVGLHEPLVVGEQHAGRRGFFRWFGRQACANGARFDRREHGKALETGQVVGHEIDCDMRGCPELLRIHVAEPVGLASTDVRERRSRRGVRAGHPGESTRCPSATVASATRRGARRTA